ncbi:MAG: DUF724 domain-containing protein [Bacteroidales bacterium]|nr:DUF724 domain-containing protein [Bacteroidales bacterium]MCF8336722.1 DUF724 domain-containing protein [Bacteroidales bacterium]
MSFKNIIITLIVIAVVILGLGYLYTEGYINTDWEILTIILGALAIPYKYLRNRFRGFAGGYEKIDRIIEQQDERKKGEKKHREEYDKKIREKELRIQLLEEKLEKIDSRIENMEMKKEDVSREVKNMDEEKLKNTFEESFKRNKG